MAASDFSQARELDPANLESWIGLGMSLAMQNRVYDAIGVLEDLLKLHPDFVRGHMQMGMLQYKLCATNKGRAHMEKALASRPSLQERRQIEQILKEQKAMDDKRLYRPDFEKLNKENPGLFSGMFAGASAWIGKMLGKGKP